jgi:BRCT domain type II-containing protein
MFDIKGWRIEITGRAKYGTRPIVNRLLQDHGALTANEVGINTTVLLLGRQSGAKKPKQIKAENLGIPTYDADAFIEHLQQGTTPPNIWGSNNVNAPTPPAPPKPRPDTKKNRQAAKTMKALVSASRAHMGDFAV